MSFNLVKMLFSVATRRGNIEAMNEETHSIFLRIIDRELRKHYCNLSSIQGLMQ